MGTGETYPAAAKAILRFVAENALLFAKKAATRKGSETIPYNLFYIDKHYFLFISFVSVG